MRVDTHLQEFHNKFIFSTEGKQIRDKFTSLLSIYIEYRELNNIHTIDTKILTRNICNNLEKPELYNELLQIIEQPEALKVLLVFFLKGFSWTSELYTRFNISRNFFVDKTVNTLKKHKLLLKEDADSINFHYFEIIKKCNQNEFRRTLGQAQFLFVTPDLIKLGFELIEYYEYLVKTSLTVGKTLQSTIKATLIFVSQFKRIKEEEENQFSRRHFTDDGILFETETQRSINFKEELKNSMLEHKQELLLEKQEKNMLSEQESNSLQVITNQLTIKENSEIVEFKKTKVSTITHNGQKYTFDEYDRKLEEQRLIDEEIENTTTIIGKPELCSEIPTTISGRPYTSMYLSKEGLEELKYSEEKKPEPKTEFDKAFDFLDSLLPN